MPLGEGVGSTGRENKVLPTISQRERGTGRTHVSCHGNTIMEALSLFIQSIESAHILWFTSTLCIVVKASAVSTFGGIGQCCFSLIQSV